MFVNNANRELNKAKSMRSPDDMFGGQVRAKVNDDQGAAGLDMNR